MGLRIPCSRAFADLVKDLAGDLTSAAYIRGLVIADARAKGKEIPPEPKLYNRRRTWGPNSVGTTMPLDPPPRVDVTDVATGKVVYRGPIPPGLVDDNPSNEVLVERLREHARAKGGKVTVLGAVEEPRLTREQWLAADKLRGAGMTREQILEAVFGGDAEPKGGNEE